MILTRQQSKRYIYPNRAKNVFMSADLHTPVLLTEVLQLTAPEAGNAILDGTLGLGGHAAAFLERIGQSGQLLGLDADSRNLALARERLAQYPQFRAEQTNFRDLAEFAQPASMDIIFLDIGISSPHFDDATRGFSYRADGALDMRLDTAQELTAAGIVNEYPENELADVFYQFGEIISSRRLTADIVKIRKEQSIETTTQLREIIEESVGGRVLGQAFQALRIAVNDELGALTKGLEAAFKALKPGGRLAVISFHSLEDRIVKNYFREQKQAKLATVLTKKPVVPSAAELEQNPRSRSAKLRVLKKN